MPDVTIVCAAMAATGRRRKPWMPPGAPPELAAAIRAARPGTDVVGWDETAEGYVDSNLLNNSSLVLLTGLTPSYGRMNEIAAYCQAHHIPLVAGGRDVIGWSREPDGMELLAQRFSSFCTTNIDIVLMAQILDDANTGNLRLHYGASNDSVQEPPIPDRSVVTPSNYFAPYAVRSSSGCNRSCPWCTVGGQGLSYKSGTALEAELRSFRSWFFLDTSDSFAGDANFVQEVTLPIYKASRMRWGTEAVVDDLLGKDGNGHLIDEMRQAGCMIAYIGIESVTRLVSKSNLERAKEVIRHCRRVGMIVIGSLMLDVFKDETVEEVEQAIAFARKWLDFAQFSLTAMLPGSALRAKALRDKEIIEADWRKFDGAHPTVKHALTSDVRSYLLNRAYRITSSPWCIGWRAMRAKGFLAQMAILLGGLRYRSGIPQYQSASSLM